MKLIFKEGDWNDSSIGLVAQTSFLKQHSPLTDFRSCHCLKFRLLALTTPKSRL